MYYYLKTVKWAFLMKVTLLYDSQNGCFILQPRFEKPDFPFVYRIVLECFSHNRCINIGLP